MFKHAFSIKITKVNCVFSENYFYLCQLLLRARGLLQLFIIRHVRAQAA
jgi:hypothetical protein